MTTGYILILATLLLGGVIATVGDRLGTKVGKARLSLFNLRPRQTAVLITILTGSVISAATLGVLLAIDSRLRTGIFELQEIQDGLAMAQRELEETREQKDGVEAELGEARSRQEAAQRRLNATNRFLSEALERQTRTEEQLNQAQSQLDRTEDQLSQVASNFQIAQDRLATVTRQASILRNEIQEIQAERAELIRQRDAELAERDAVIADREAEISARDAEIAQRDQTLAQREARLRDLEAQREFLEQDVRTLERNFQVLRQGNVALLRNESLASAVVRIPSPATASSVVDRLLQEANRVAIRKTRPGTTVFNERVIQVPQAEVDQLIEQISDGRDYVVRILSAGNYLVGEAQVLVFADAVLNRLVFAEGEVIASTSADLATLSNDELSQRIDLLLRLSQFRARQAGILFSESIQIGDGRLDTLVSFVEQLQAQEGLVNIQAVASENTFTGSPLRVNLMAMQGSRVLFQTPETGLEAPPEEEAGVTAN
ncbi:DUF3084 domain-containing protein [Geitlerinema sp. PCC 7407]|uniref:DUF3084 domain-containing protein n=1 Tax=Geitlerinema sp. PCC 7407 TaxID=1173025 RepID=UPI00029FC554|nr:DUF3084 domain-containing protein [Geitlerinema sp. PCC 7407]AFY67091.1 hypothetical protein GEI7407_2618 [Geitlerinema sp. PCC 7407]